MPSPPPAPEGKMLTFMQGIMATGYLMPLVKATELVCGLAILSGLYIRLALVVIFPIVINIVCINAFMAPKNLPMMIVLLLANLFLAFYYRNAYKPMLAMK